MFPFGMWEQLLAPRPGRAGCSGGSSSGRAQLRAAPAWPLPPLQLVPEPWWRIRGTTSSRKPRLPPVPCPLRWPPQLASCGSRSVAQRGLRALRGPGCCRPQGRPPAAGSQRVRTGGQAPSPDAGNDVAGFFFVLKGLCSLSEPISLLKLSPLGLTSVSALIFQDRYVHWFQCYGNKSGNPVGAGYLLPAAAEEQTCVLGLGTTPEHGDTAPGPHRAAGLAGRGAGRAGGARAGLGIFELLYVEADRRRKPRDVFLSFW